MARLRGENPGAEGKPSGPQAMRGPGVKAPKSRASDPKPSDLGLVNVKRRESSVEA